MSEATPPATETAKVALSLRLVGARTQRVERSGRVVAVCVSGPGLHAVFVERSGGQLRVLRSCESGAATPLDAAAELSRAGFPDGECVLALPREQAMVLPVELPADDEAELRSMARMAIARDAIPEGVVAESDFQIVARDGARTSVLLASSPRARIDAAIERAARPVGRVSVRSLGTAAFVRGHPALSRGFTLVVDVAPGIVECTLVRDGRLAHTRGVTLGEATAQAAMFEVRRMLAALRGADGALTIDRIALACPQELAEELSRGLAPIVQCEVERIESHPAIAFADEGVRRAALAFGVPLLGLLLEDDAALRGEGLAIDLLHPTQEIDVAARNRRRALLVAGGLVVAALAGWTLGAQSFRSLEARRDDLEQKARGALPELRRFKRDELKLAHVDAYMGLAPQWLAHLDGLRRFAPDQSSVVLDGLTAQLAAAEIEYTADGKFVARPELRFVLDGEALDRASADGLRDALVREKTYTLSSTGADGRGGRRLAAPFAYTLRTTEIAPKSASADATAKPSGSGGAR